MRNIQKFSKKKEIHWTADGQMLDLQPHTEIKHRLLESYLEDWVIKLAGSGFRSTKTVTLVDAFCGGGVYRDGTSEQPGSPIRMIRAIEKGWQAVKESQSYKDELNIAYRFVDARREHTDCLKQEIRKAGYSYLLDQGVCQVVTSDFEDDFDTCLDWVQERGGHSFFFLDPFGQADLHGMAREILNIKGSEVLLNHMFQEGYKRSIIRAFNQGYGQSFLEKHNIEEYSWLENFKELSLIEQQALTQDTTLAIYRSKSKAEFVWNFALLKSKDHIYNYLVHLSNNATAVSVMRQSLWRYNNLNFQFHYPIYGLGYCVKLDRKDDFQLDLFDIKEQNHDACRERVFEEVDRYLYRTSGFKFKDIYAKTVDLHPATREDLMQVARQEVLNGNWEIIRDDRSICTSRLNNGDIVKPAKVKQLVLVSGVSGRVRQKTQTHRRGSVASTKKSLFGQVQIPGMDSNC